MKRVLHFESLEGRRMLDGSEIQVALAPPASMDAQPPPPAAPEPPPQGEAFWDQVINDLYTAEEAYEDYLQELDDAFAMVPGVYAFVPDAPGQVEIPGVIPIVVPSVVPVP